MKRTALIELGVIAVAMILVYRLVFLIISVLIQFYYIAAGDFPGNRDPGWITNLLYILLFFSAFYLLVSYKKNLSVFINGREENEITGLNFTSLGLLQVLIIILCLSTLISELPLLLTALIRSVSSASPDDMSSFQRKINGINTWTSVFKTLLAAFLLFYAGPVSAFLNRNMGFKEKEITT